MKPTHFVTLGISLIVLVVAASLLFTGQAEVTGNVVNVEADYIEIKGSDTLLQMVSNLAEAYSEQDPNTKISVTGGGSGTGIAAVLNGEVSVADSSRKIKDKEVELAAQKGLDIVEVKVARDMLSVIAHPENDVTELTKEEIGKIFSGDITNWNQVGGQDKEITLYGRQSTSGTYAFFLEEVVKAEYSPTMRNMEGNQAILEAVRQDKTSIGYVGIGYVTDENGQPLQDITIVNVAADDASEYISPFDETKPYPISRHLYQYLSNPPPSGSPLHDFITFEVSDEGQDIVEQSGFVKLTEEDKQETLAQLSA